MIVKIWICILEIIGVSGDLSMLLLSRLDDYKNADSRQAQDRDSDSLVAPVNQLSDPLIDRLSANDACKTNIWILNLKMLWNSIEKFSQNDGIIFWFSGSIGYLLNVDRDEKCCEVVNWTMDVQSSSDSIEIEQKLLSWFANY